MAQRHSRHGRPIARSVGAPIISICAYNELSEFGHTEALDEAAAFILQPIGLRVEAVSEGLPAASVQALLGPTLPEPRTGDLAQSHHKIVVFPSTALTSERDG